MSRRFRVTFDYRCPFAYNAHAAIIAALREGVDLDVTYVPFSLDQAHVAEGEPPVWERPIESRGSGTTALLFGLAVRDRFPDAFEAFHLAAFAARHDEARAIAEESVMREVAASVGLDPDAVAAVTNDPATLARLAAEHTAVVDEFDVWGVPTFITETSATFIRFMQRGDVPDLLRALDLLDVETINEFKRTTVPR